MRTKDVEETQHVSSPDKQRQC